MSPQLVLQLRDGQAEELLNYLIGSDMRMSIGDRTQIAKQIRRQIRQLGHAGPTSEGCPECDGLRRYVMKIVEDERIRRAHMGGFTDAADTTGPYAVGNDQQGETK